MNDKTHKLGVWRVAYKHIPVEGRYVDLPSLEQTIETHLELGSLAEAQAVIAAIKQNLDNDAR